MLNYMLHKYSFILQMPNFLPTIVILTESCLLLLIPGFHQEPFRHLIDHPPISSLLC